MTWDDLAECIAQMSPEQRKKEVKYVEPYDATRILPVAAYEAVEEINEDEEEGDDKIVANEWYLG
jgi:hypothetical protein